MRVIEETKIKAEQILTNRKDSLVLRKSLDSSRKSELKKCVQMVRQRNTSAASSNLVSGSVALARLSVEDRKKMRHEDTQEFKMFLKWDMKKSKKKQLKSLSKK